MISTGQFLDIIKPKEVRYPYLIYYATIDPNYTTGDPKVIFDGENTLTTKTYKCVNYTPVAGDRVVMLKKGENDFIIIGKIGGGSGGITAADVSVADTEAHFTSNPKNVENVLAELFTNVSNGKTLIASAITDKGGTANGSNTFQQLHDAIVNLPSFALTAGDSILIASADTERTTTSSTDVKLKEIQIKVDGTVRVKFDLKSTSGLDVYGNIYINGVFVTGAATRSSTYTTYTKDITVNANDLIQLYASTSIAGFATYVRNFRIYIASNFTTVNLN